MATDLSKRLAKAAHGGARAGSGRKPAPPEQAALPRTVRLSDERWAKLRRLGREWLERQIDRAKEAG